MLMWWGMPLFPVLGRLRQEDHKFKASLGYLVRVCLKTPKEGRKYKEIPIECYPSSKKGEKEPGD
jgi:hypothetical protein